MNTFPLEEKVQQLEAIEQRFQHPDLPLEEAVAKHREALKLAKEVLEYLKKVESSIEELNLETAE